MLFTKKEEVKPAKMMQVLHYVGQERMTSFVHKECIERICFRRDPVPGHQEYTMGVFFNTSPQKMIFSVTKHSYMKLKREVASW